MQTPKGEINDKIMELVNDEEIIAKLAAAGSAQECYDLVKDRIGISFEEFQASMAVANAYVNEQSEGELSEDDLDSVAGGKGNTRVDFTTPTIDPRVFTYNDPTIHFGPAILNCLK